MGTVKPTLTAVLCAAALAVPATAATPTEVDKLLASDGAADDRFGESVSVSGETVVVGAQGDDEDGIDQGSAYVFVQSSAGPTLSGVVTGDVQQGVTLTLSGAASATTTSAADGSYSVTWLYGGDYVVTPSRAGYAFTPASEAVTVLGIDVTGVDFAAQAAGGGGGGGCGSSAPVLALAALFLALVRRRRPPLSS